MNSLNAVFPSPPSAASPVAKARWSPRRLLALALPAVLGALVGYWLTILLYAHGAPLGGWLSARLDFELYTWLLLPLLWWLMVLVHEIGHLLGAKLAGMRPALLMAGPLHLEWTANGAWRMQPNRITQAFGGLALAIPRGDSGRAAFAMLAIGGPAASMLTGLVLLPVALGIGGSGGGILFLTAILSLAIAMLTLLPMRAGGFLSDGAQLLGLLRGDGETRQRMALSMLYALSHHGTRPRDWDPNLLVDPAQAHDPTLRRLWTMLHAARAEDLGELATADRLWAELARGLDASDAIELAPALRAAMALCIATWLAHQRRDAAAARAWYASSRGAFSFPAVTAFYETALARAEGDQAGLRAGIERTRKLLPELHDRGSAVVMAEALSQFEQELSTPQQAG